MSGGLQALAPTAGLVRVMKRVEIQPDGCWRWTGSVNSYGYPVWSAGPKGARVYVHLYMRQLFHGPMPAGHVADHTCHDPARCAGGRACPHRRCVHPSHCEPVTVGENTRRGGSPSSINRAKTECPRGHVYSKETLIQTASGRRKCKVCHRDRARARSAARRGE